jgi:hypothetical protein
VGLAATILATASTKLGIATMAAAAVGLAGVGGVSVLSESPLPERAQVTSFHYTTQLRTTNQGPSSSLSKGAYEQWYSLPDGVDGPLFMRMQRWTPQREVRQCAWLQNAQANYYYSSDEKRLYIHNHRVFWSNLKVWRLPTDSAEFTDFLSQVEGQAKGIVHTRDRSTGLLADTVDNRFVDALNFRTEYSYNTTGEEQFICDWPSDVGVVDMRDRMHKRGWTYFRVHGHVDGKRIEGRGQVPFVYEACQEHPPWMMLNVGDDLQIVDCSDGAYLRHPEDGTLIASHPQGTFFKGLARPWMGMHAMNAIRRDAVEQRVWFETKPGSNQRDVVVTLMHENGGRKTDLVYTINARNDIIKDIRFDVQKVTRGSLVFEHLNSVDGIGDTYSEPTVLHGQPAPVEQGQGMPWLVSLVQGSLGT